MQLHYDEAGDGPLVVLLHGFPENRTAWKHQLPSLAAAGFRAVAPDLRGYGNSPRPRGVASYAIPELVGDVAELIQSLSGRPCIVVGHDWGAFVAWFLAMTRPELVSRLAILNVPHPAAYARELARSNEQKLRSSYQLFFRLPLLPELSLRLFGGMLLRKMSRFREEEIDAYRASWRGSLTPMLNYYRALGRARGTLRKLVQPIHVPVLLIWGEREPVFLPSTLDDVDQWVPRLRIERIARAGHFVQHDAAARVSELLVEFAKGHDGRPDLMP